MRADSALQPDALRVGNLPHRKTHGEKSVRRDYPTTDFVEHWQRQIIMDVFGRLTAAVRAIPSTFRLAHNVPSTKNLSAGMSSMKGRLVANHRSHDGSTQGTRVVDDDGTTSSGDATPSGELNSSAKLMPPKTPLKKKIRELAVCNMLIDKLNLDGRSWGTAEDFEKVEKIVDCIARDAEGNELRVQVTTAEYDEEVWRNLSMGLEVKGKATPDDLADRLLEVIKKKAKNARPNIVLAIDGSQMLQFAFNSVCNSFSSRHGSHAASIGFKEIWMVGPTPDLTF